MGTIKNPILRGFNPDPSIIRVGKDYYIATSTFEWFPGVQIHHSRDLVNWHLVARPLDRVSQLDLKGVPDSCGVWAPCLSYAHGTFYLVYSNVKSFDGPWKDTPNYLVTTTDITGAWSEPVYLSSFGFDGSLFHDDDGKKWYTSMLVDHRNEDFFGGIVLQEYDPGRKRLVGPLHPLTSGTALGLTEGPHLYKKDGYYYMLLAEGGTEYGHAATVMRATALTGPYDPHPDNPLVTSRDKPRLELQKAGHASMVETQHGNWYIAFLVGRPLSTHGRCILGRETALEEVDWVAGWPVLKHGSPYPRVEVPAPPMAVQDNRAATVRDTFEAETLNIHYQSLRVPAEEDWCSLRARPGYLRLRGRESLSSVHNQSLIARRVQGYAVVVSTCVDFAPDTFQQMAGLVFYYNTGHFHYLHVTFDETRSQRVLCVLTCDNFTLHQQAQVIGLETDAPVILKGVLDRAALQFYYSTDGHTFAPIGGVLDASILSDDYIREGSDRYRPAFTGCFVGMCCQDLAFNTKTADFKWFEYLEPA